MIHSDFILSLPLGYAFFLPKLMVPCGTPTQCTIIQDSVGPGLTGPCSMIWGPGEHFDKARACSVETTSFYLLVSLPDNKKLRNKKTKSKKLCLTLAMAGAFSPLRAQIKYHLSTEPGIDNPTCLPARATFPGEPIIIHYYLICPYRWGQESCLICSLL